MYFSLLLYVLHLAADEKLELNRVLKVPRYLELYDKSISLLTSAEIESKGKRDN